MLTYRINPVIAQRHPDMVTTVPTNEGGFKTVSLVGPLTHDKPGDKHSPPVTRKIPVATQSELKYLHGKGHPFIEAVETVPHETEGKPVERIKNKTVAPDQDNDKPE